MPFIGPAVCGDDDGGHEHDLFPTPIPRTPQGERDHQATRTEGEEMQRLVPPMQGVQLLDFIAGQRGEKENRPCPEDDGRPGENTKPSG